METVLEVKYINGRVHGTPWGTSHNEGVVEFPPSPWRILRSLVSTWFERSQEVPEATVRSLVDALSRVSPSYIVPKFSQAHKRHFFPDSSHLEGMFELNKKGEYKQTTPTSKTFDAFSTVNQSDALYVTWPIELSALERKALANLANQLPYLGRAESLVQARLLAEGEAVPTNSESRTISTAPNNQLNASPIRLLSPSAETDWDSLILIPWKPRNHVRPPGTKQVNYFADRPLEWKPGRASSSAKPRVNVIEWSIQGQGKIPLTSALLYCELVRQEVLGFCKRKSVQLDWRITGKEEGQQSQRHHEHIYFLPVSKNGFLSGIQAWLPKGVAGDASIEEATVRSFSSLTKIADQPLQGRNRSDLPDFREVRVFLQHIGIAATTKTPSFSGSALWETLTPYAPPRHLRSDNRFERSLYASVRKDLAELGHPEPLDIELLKVSAQGFHALDFRRHRATKNEKLRDGRPAFHLQLRFAEEVSGPISIGTHSHFGLGHFVPCSESGASTQAG
jgi:CRISPR-associated protein Csb2